MAGYTEEEYGRHRDTVPVDPPKGSADWAAQNSGDNASGRKPAPDPVPGTLEAHEQRQAATSETGGASTEATATPPSAESRTASTDTERQMRALSPEERQRADATAGIDRKIAAYRAYIDSLPELETPEKRARRERLEKSKRIVGAVSDGLRAMSNLWFTSRYAPDMYDHENGSQLRATNKWIEKARAERERNRDEHLRFAIGLGDAENQRAATLRELEAQQERQRLAREKAEREAEEHGWNAALQPDKQREQKGKADTAERKARITGAEADAAPEMWEDKKALGKARIRTEESRTLRNRAGASADYARGASYGSKKHHFRGREYISEKDYTKDVTEAARQYNERHKNEKDFVPIVIEREVQTGIGNKRIVARKPEEYAGEVERRLELEKAQASQGKKKTNVNWKK